MPAPPQNGVLACIHSDYVGRLCLPSCNRDYDFAAQPDDVYHCANGQWMSFPWNRGLPMPDCSGKNLGKSNTPISHHLSAPLYNLTKDAFVSRFCVKYSQMQISCTEKRYCFTIERVRMRLRLYKCGRLLLNCTAVVK